METVFGKRITNAATAEAQSVKQVTPSIDEMIITLSVCVKGIIAKEIRKDVLIVPESFALHLARQNFCSDPVLDEPRFRGPGPRYIDVPSINVGESSL